MDIMNSWLSFLRPLFYYSQWIFSSPKGFRQGDPLLSSLFTLAANYLSQRIIAEETKGLFRGFQVGTHKVNVST